MYLKHRYKVLPLTAPFTVHRKYWKDCVGTDRTPSIPPRFNRNGWYYDRLTKEAWLEIDGEAWSYYPETFLYALSLLNHRALLPKEAEAISLLIQAKLCPKSLVDMYRTDWDIKSFRATFVRSWLWRRSVLGK